MSKQSFTQPKMGTSTGIFRFLLDCGLPNVTNVSKLANQQLSEIGITSEVDPGGFEWAHNQPLFAQLLQQSEEIVQ